MWSQLLGKLNTDLLAGTSIDKRPLRKLFRHIQFRSNNECSSFGVYAENVRRVLKFEGSIEDCSNGIWLNAQTHKDSLEDVVDKEIFFGDTLVKRLDVCLNSMEDVEKRLGNLPYIV